MGVMSDGRYREGTEIEPQPRQHAGGDALTVSQLTARIKGTVENAFPMVAVTGEISNFSRPRSGHCYFTLKDENAQIRGVMWRSNFGRVRFEVSDGLEVVCVGPVEVYSPRGTYQLIVQRMEPLGLGAWQIALAKLRDRLAAEGLFAPERKRPLPAFPRRIGIVTSPTGAAIRDFLEVTRRRWRGVDILVIPARVQGDGAAREIARAIETSARLDPPLDVLVVGRGGGSLEELWAFNEEPVVRAIAESAVPTVSAVGHEVDVTLADLAADVRALTPSEAAELVVRSADEISGMLASYQQRLTALVREPLRTHRMRLDALASARSISRPLEVLHEQRRRCQQFSLRADAALERLLSSAASRTETLAGKLESLSPLAVLARGYSVTRLADSGDVLQNGSQVYPGDRIITRLAEGQVESRVE